MSLVLNESEVTSNDVKEENNQIGRSIMYVTMPWDTLFLTPPQGMSCGVLRLTSK